MTMKIGIVGAGGMAAYHVMGFQKAGATVVAVADPDAKRSMGFADRYGVLHTYKDLDQMLEAHPELDAVSIVTPNKFHEELSVRALKAGKHVYCEKPPARSASEVQRMHDAALQADKILMFGFNNRCRPESVAL